MKTIVALVDFSDLTFKVLKQAHTLAKAFDSEVIILHMVPQPVVVDIGSAIAEAGNVKKRAEDHAKLLEVRDSLIKFGVRASVEELEDATMEGVLAESKKLEAELIILGSHHHSAFYNLLVGSVTHDVLKRAHCPVLVVPSDDGAQEKQ